MEVKWTIKSNSWMNGKKMFTEDCEKWRKEKRIWRVGSGHPERGLIRINPRSYSSLVISTLHHSRLFFMIFVALGISFSLCTSRWKQCGNYTNNERLIKSRFRHNDAVVGKIWFICWNLLNRVIPDVEHVSRKEKVIQQLKLFTKR